MARAYVKVYICACRYSEREYAPPTLAHAGWLLPLSRIFLSGSYKPIIPRQNLLLREKGGNMSTTGNTERRGRGTQLHLKSESQRLLVYICSIQYCVLSVSQWLSYNVIDWRVKRSKSIFEQKFWYFATAKYVRLSVIRLRVIIQKFL